MPVRFPSSSRGIGTFQRPPVSTRSAVSAIRADVKTVTDGQMTSGQNTLSSTAAAFTGFDQGKLVTVAGAGAAGATLYSTIVSVTGGVATLGTTAGTTVSGATVNYGTDDTTAIQAALTAGTATVLPGISAISGPILPPTNSVLKGIGSQVSILRCMTPTARIQFGPAIGSVPIQYYGVQEGWGIDGNALATGPLLIVNTTNSVFTDIISQNSLGDGTVVGGQNVTFTNLASGEHVNSLVLDNGCGGNVFIKPEISFASAWHLELRQTVAPVAYLVPENNYFYGGIFEQSWNGTNLGCIHQLAGNRNHFNDMNFYTGQSGATGLKIEPNTVSGRSSDLSNRVYFNGENTFSGPGGSSIAIDVGALTLTNTDVPVVFGGQVAFANWGTAYRTATVAPAQIVGSMERSSVTTWLAATGSGQILLSQPSHSNAHAGYVAPSTPGFALTGLAQTASSSYFSTFVVTKPFVATKIVFYVTVASATDDPIDVGIYSAVSGARISHSGATTGMVNSTGQKSVTIPAASLDQGNKYTLAIAYGPSGAPATLLMAQWASNVSLFTPDLDSGVMASYPLPSTSIAVSSTGYGAYGAVQ